MALLPITPRRVAPYIISGATGLHILARLRHASRQPAVDRPLHFFLLRHTDVVLSLGGASVAIWHLANHEPRPQTISTLPRSTPISRTEKSVIANVVHELRQIFTALLLGLGLVRNKAKTGDTQGIPGLVQRLMSVVRKGIEEVDVLDASESGNSQEREYGA